MHLPREDPPPSRLPTKVRVYRLLRDGRSVADAARTLGISKQGAHAHALDLERRQALQRVPTPRGQPILYERGPRATEFEDAAGRQSTTRPGRLARQPPVGVGVRVHGAGGGYRFRVVSGPELTVPWDRSWNPNDPRGEPTDFALRRVFANGTWRFWLKRSPRGSVLLVQPPEEWVYDARMVHRARAERQERVRAVTGAFAKEFQFKLAGEGLSGRLEYAVPAPGVMPFGDPVADAVWADDSDGDGVAEVETASAPIAAAIVELPRWRDEVEQRVGNLESGAGVLRDARSRLARVEANLNEVREVVAHAVRVDELEAVTVREIAAAVAAQSARRAGDAAPSVTGERKPAPPGPEVA